MNNLDAFQEFHEKMNMYLDNALPKEDEQAFLNQVHDDPDCSRLYASEKNFRDPIRNNIQRTHVSPHLIQNIKNKIRVL